MDVPLKTTNGNGQNGNGYKQDALQHPSIVVGNRKAEIEAAVRSILINVGEDPDREGLVKTPHRVAKAWFELLEGYEKDLDTVVNNALFTPDYDDGEMVMVANIEYQSMCEHHMLPFTGTAHVAYVPNGKVIGLSKIPRIVDMFARRLQIQEQLTNEIADAVEQVLEPRGVMVVMSGHHTCGSLRGVKKHGTNMVTTARRGEFRTNRDLRDEFYHLLQRADQNNPHRIG